MSDQFITRSAFCAKLGIHADTARRWERAGRLTPYAITGGLTRYSVADVERLIAEARYSTRKRPGPKPRPKPITANLQPAA